MASEKKDFLSGSVMDDLIRKGIESLRGALVKRKGKRTLNVLELDATGLIEMHNGVFGIDSCEPTAAMRYDRRRRTDFVLCFLILVAK